MFVSPSFNFQFFITGKSISDMTYLLSSEKLNLKLKSVIWLLLIFMYFKKTNQFTETNISEMVLQKNVLSGVNILFKKLQFYYCH